MSKLHSIALRRRWKRTRKKMMSYTKRAAKVNRVLLLRKWGNKRFRKKGLKQLSEARTYIKNTLARKRKNPEFEAKLRAAISKGVKKKWRTDPEFAKMVIEKNLSKGRLCPSKLQMAVTKTLIEETEIPLVMDYLVGTYRIDIADSKRKLGIELNGAYWHNLRKVSSKRKRSRLLRDGGWKILHIHLRKNRLSAKQYDRCVDFLV